MGPRANLFSVVARAANTASPTWMRGMLMSRRRLLTRAWSFWFCLHSWSFTVFAQSRVMLAWILSRCPRSTSSGTASSLIVSAWIWLVNWRTGHEICVVEVIMCLISSSIYLSMYLLVSIYLSIYLCRVFWNSRDHRNTHEDSGVASVVHWYPFIWIKWIFLIT